MVDLFEDKRQVMPLLKSGISAMTVMLEMGLVTKLKRVKNFAQKV